ncbi:MAG: hypothetical protein JWN20_2342, partial [Jatrophihabitantaceae bacterium]|nr:hypothetical protein [Jatrophihabitantaceae bacterium]
MRAGIAEADPPELAPRHRSPDARTSALAFDDELGNRRERIGWVRGIISSLVVALATGLVIGSCALLLRSVDPVTSAIAAVATSAPAPEVPPVVAAEAPAPAPATTAPPAPVVSAAPVQATGRVAEGDRSLSFIISQAQLHAGKAVSVTVSATGPDTDRIQLVNITTADGTSLTSGTAAGCAGPAYPWSQAFAITFASAESTEIRVQLTSCT